MRRMGTKNCLELGFVKKREEDGYIKQFGTGISKKLEKDGYEKQSELDK